MFDQVVAAANLLMCIGRRLGSPRTIRIETNGWISCWRTRLLFTSMIVSIFVTAIGQLGVSEPLTSRRSVAVTPHTVH